MDFFVEEANTLLIDKSESLLHHDHVITTDIDDCKTAKRKRKNCGDVATCENTEGSFHCECPEGFSFDKKERECYGKYNKNLF